MSKILELMKIDIHKSFSAELEKEWIALEKHSLAVTPFQSYAWLSHWFKEVGSSVNKMEPAIVRVSIDNMPHLILPFGIRLKKGVKILEWMGGIQTDYMLPLSLKGSSILANDFEKTWSLINEKLPPYDLMYLTKQPDLIGDIANPFVTIFPHKDLTNSHQAILEDTWERYVDNNVSKKVLADTRRQRKRLSTLGKLRFIVAENKSKINEITKTMIFQKGRRFNETGIWNMFEIKEYRRLYKNLDQELGCLGKVHCSALYLDEKIIATHWGFLSSNCFYYIMPSHDGGSFAKFSPGKLLLENLIKLCIEIGIQAFDFTVGDETYKKIWTNSTYVLSESVRPMTLKGKTYKLFLFIRFNVKRVPLFGWVAKKIYNLIRES